MGSSSLLPFLPHTSTISLGPGPTKGRRLSTDLGQRHCANPFASCSDCQGLSCPTFHLTPFHPGGHIPHGPRGGAGAPSTAGAAHNQGPWSCLWPMQPAAPPHFAEGEVTEWERGSVAGITWEARRDEVFCRLEKVHPHSLGYPGSARLVYSRIYSEVKAIAKDEFISIQTNLV